MALHELIYLSAATRHMTPGDLTSLLDQSREKNARLRVTGMLIYHQRDFMQLLEGDKATIFALYSTICTDERNHRNYLMWDGAVDQRAFSQWSMAFMAPADAQLDGRPAYSQFLRHGLTDVDRNYPGSTGKALLLSLRDDFLKQR